MFHKPKSLNPLNYFNEATKTVRILSFLLSFTLTTFVFTTPTFAAGVEAVKSKNKVYVEASSERLQDNVDKALEIIKSLKDPTLEETKKEALSSQLSTLLTNIKAEDTYAQDEFSTMLEEIQTKGLPDVFKERVVAMQEVYKQRQSTLVDAMESLVSEHTGNIFVKIKGTGYF